MLHFFVKRRDTIIINTGLENELRIISTINQKNIDCIKNSEWSNVLTKIFPKAKRSKTIICKKCKTYSKADIKIKVGNKKALISIKCNSASIVHSCYLSKFLLFLKKYNVSIKTIKIIKLFHYGDGTLDGTGKTRLNFNQIMTKYYDLIQYANKEINSNRKLVIDFVNGCLFNGFYKSNEKANYIYHGNEIRGSIASKIEILYFLNIKSFSYIKTLHIGPITIHPYARYTNFKENNPNKRQMIQCDWANLSEDIYYIYNGFKKEDL